MDTTSSSLPPHSVPKMEARFYYAGLPSCPVLVYRTSTTPWKQPTGPDELKELRPVYDHKIRDVWEALGPRVFECLDSKQVKWTSVDIVCFKFAKDGEPPGPVVIWIGVMPQSLSGEDAHTAAIGCLQLLKLFQLTDVEVEFRESIRW